MADTVTDIVKQALRLGIDGSDCRADPEYVLLDLTDADMDRRPTESAMSIGQQLVHTYFWADLFLQNMRDGSPHWAKVWNDAPRDLTDRFANWDELHQALVDTLREAKEVIDRQTDIGVTYPEVCNVSFLHIAVVYISHLSYHLGQVVLTRKIHGIWPPKAEGFEHRPNLVG